MNNILKNKKYILSGFFFICVILFIGFGSMYFNNAKITNVNADESISINQCEKCVYLTFDDGPSNNTKELLNVLNKYDVKATFFVIGTHKNAGELMKLISQGGHIVAPHCYCHEYDKIYASPETFIADFCEIEKSIYNYTGQNNKIFRFPGGSANCYVPFKTMQEIINQMTLKGYKYYDWNIVSGDDTSVVYPAKTLYSNIIKQGFDKDNLIILFHDTNLAKTTPDAVEMVIKHYKELGYNFCLLNDELKPIQFRKPSENLNI